MFVSSSKSLQTRGFHVPLSNAGDSPACPHHSGAVLSILLLAVHVMQGTLTCHDPGEETGAGGVCHHKALRSVSWNHRITEIGRDL